MLLDISIFLSNHSTRLQRTRHSHWLKSVDSPTNNNNHFIQLQGLSEEGKILRSATELRDCDDLISHYTRLVNDGDHEPLNRSKMKSVSPLEVL